MQTQAYEVIDREHLGGRLRKHARATIARSVSIDVSADVTVCEGAVIAEEVLILTHDHSCPGDKARDVVTATPLIVGVRAFIGARSIVLPKVRRIGTGAMLGAGSVLTRDVPPYELWAGNPACFIRKLEPAGDAPPTIG